MLSPPENINHYDDYQYSSAQNNSLEFAIFRVEEVLNLDEIYNSWSQIKNYEEYVSVSGKSRLDISKRTSSSIVANSFRSLSSAALIGLKDYFLCDLRKPAMGFRDFEEIELKKNDFIFMIKHNLLENKHPLSIVAENLNLVPLSIKYEKFFHVNNNVALKNLNVNNQWYYKDGISLIVATIDFEVTKEIKDKKEIRKELNSIFNISNPIGFEMLDNMFS